MNCQMVVFVVQLSNFFKNKLFFNITNYFNRDDLLTAVEYLITSENYKLDFVLVETNGLADPS